MTKYENECVGCHAEIGCLGSSCPNRNVPHFFCDECGDEADKLYNDGYGSELCKECAVKAMNQIILGFSFAEMCEATGFSEVT